MDKCPEAVEGVFYRITPTYDDLNRLVSFSLDRGWRRRALDALDARDGKLILDVATGTGDMALLIAARIMGGDRAAYRYLADSIITFPSPGRVEAMMEENGSRLISSEALTLGSCHLYVAERKPKA